MTLILALYGKNEIYALCDTLISLGNRADVPNLLSPVKFADGRRNPDVLQSELGSKAFYVERDLVLWAGTRFFAELLFKELSAAKSGDERKKAAEAFFKDRSIKCGLSAMLFQNNAGKVRLNTWGCTPLETDTGEVKGFMAGSGQGDLLWSPFDFDQLPNDEALGVGLARIIHQLIFLEKNDREHAAKEYGLGYELFKGCGHGYMRSMDYRLDEFFQHQHRSALHHVSSINYTSRGRMSHFLTFLNENLKSEIAYNILHIPINRIGQKAKSSTDVGRLVNDLRPEFSCANVKKNLKAQSGLWGHFPADSFRFRLRSGTCSITAGSEFFDWLRETTLKVRLKS